MCLKWAIQILVYVKAGKQDNTIGHYCLPEFEPLTGSRSFPFLHMEYYTKKMNEHTNHQIITQDGKPAFAVIPWDEYQRLLRNQIDTDDSDLWFPNDVVKANVRGDTLIKAWREHFGLTQEELADRAGIRQPSLARLERGDSTPRKSTLKKLADAMDLIVEQLID